MLYCVAIGYKTGSIGYLSVRGKHLWKTLKTARKYRNEMLALLERGRAFSGAVDFWVENEFGEVIE